MVMKRNIIIKTKETIRLDEEKLQSCNGRL